MTLKLVLAYTVSYCCMIGIATRYTLVEIQQTSMRFLTFYLPTDQRTHAPARRHATCGSKTVFPASLIAIFNFSVQKHMISVIYLILMLAIE